MILIGVSTHLQRAGWIIYDQIRSPACSSFPLAIQACEDEEEGMK